MIVRTYLEEILKEYVTLKKQYALSPRSRIKEKVYWGSQQTDEIKERYKIENKKIEEENKKIEEEKFSILTAKHYVNAALETLIGKQLHEALKKDQDQMAAAIELMFTLISYIMPHFTEHYEDPLLTQKSQEWFKNEGKEILTNFCQTIINKKYTKTRLSHMDDDVFSCTYIDIDSACLDLKSKLYNGDYSRIIEETGKIQKVKHCIDRYKKYMTIERTIEINVGFENLISEVQNEIIKLLDNYRNKKHSFFLSDNKINTCTSKMEELLSNITTAINDQGKNASEKFHSIIDFIGNVIVEIRKEHSTSSLIKDLNDQLNTYLDKRDKIIDFKSIVTEKELLQGLQIDKNHIHYYYYSISIKKPDIYNQLVQILPQEFIQESINDTQEETEKKIEPLENNHETSQTITDSPEPQIVINIGPIFSIPLYNEEKDKKILIKAIRQGDKDRLLELCQAYQGQGFFLNKIFNQEEKNSLLKTTCFTLNKEILALLLEFNMLESSEEKEELLSLLKLDATDYHAKISEKSEYKKYISDEDMSAIVENAIKNKPGISDKINTIYSLPGKFLYVINNYYIKEQETMRDMLEKYSLPIIQDQQLLPKTEQQYDTSQVNPSAPPLTNEEQIYFLGQNFYPIPSMLELLPTVPPHSRNEEEEFSKNIRDRYSKIKNRNKPLPREPENNTAKTSPVKNNLIRNSMFEGSPYLQDLYKNKSKYLSSLDEQTNENQKSESTQNLESTSTVPSDQEFQNIMKECPDVPMNEIVVNQTTGTTTQKNTRRVGLRIPGGN